ASQNSTKAASSSSTGNVTSTGEPAVNATSSTISASQEPIQNQNLTSAILSGEPLKPSASAVTRSYSFPVLKFKGQIDSGLTVTIVWNTDGSTQITDSRGYGYTIRVPSNLGSFTLLQNSTVIDQKYVGRGLHYDIYWFPVKNHDG